MKQLVSVKTNPHVHFTTAKLLCFSWSRPQIVEQLKQQFFSLLQVINEFMKPNVKVVWFMLNVK